MWNVWKVIEDENGVKTYEVMRSFDKRPLRFDSKTKAEYFVETFRIEGDPAKYLILEDGSKL